MLEKELDLTKMKVLLVDDTPANIDVLRKTLETQGYELSFSTNGRMALNIASRVLPDLILLDVMMPEMDGFETCRHLKENESTRDIPIIFITAKTDTEDIVKGFKLGGVDYIAKPFKQEEVCSRVITHLQLRASIKSLIELNEQKNRFLGIAAHDIRSPLSSVVGFSGLMLDKKYAFTAEEQTKYLEIINSSANRILALVNDLLDISAIESGRLAFEPKSGSLSHLVRERLRDNEIIAKGKNITFHASIHEVPEFRFDSNRIAQVMDNLMGNAIKFSPPGSAIHIKLEQVGEAARVSVQDEGPGLSQEDQGKVFKTFQSLSAKPTGREKSTGLGLAIIKKLVEAHGGTVNAESPPGQGAIFHFSLPMT